MNDDDIALAVTIGNPDRPWGPYLVPEDASDTALAMMTAETLVLAFQDTAIAAQRAATIDEHVVDADTFDVLLDVRSRLARELVRRLGEVDYQTQYRRLLSPVPDAAQTRLAS